MYKFIDVLKLCRKFELILTNICPVMSILKRANFGKKTMGYSLCFFLKIGSEITPILLHFLIHIDVLILYRKWVT